MSAADLAAAPARQAAAPPLPTWRLIVALTLPVLAPQPPMLPGTLSDRSPAAAFVAGGEQSAAAAHYAAALLTGPAGGSPAHALASAAHWEAARHAAARQVAYQAAQTTANYLAWFITSYIVLVSVGSTALVARF